MSYILRLSYGTCDRIFLIFSFHLHHSNELIKWHVNTLQGNKLLVVELDNELYEQKTRHSNWTVPERRKHKLLQIACGVHINYFLLLT